MSTAHTVALDDYSSLQQASAEGFGAYSTLRKYIADGRLPAVKIGSRVKVRRSDLQALAVPTRERTYADVEAAVARVAASAPPLSPEQIRRLSALLDGAS